MRVSKGLLKKKNLPESERLFRRNKPHKKIILAMVGLVVIVVLVVAVSLNTASPRQKILGSAPAHFQTGILTNSETTLAFEDERNFNFSQGTHYTVKLVLKAGVGVNAMFGMIDSNLNLLRPYLNQTTLTPSAPRITWTGTIDTSSGYRLELGNLSDESHVATVQMYVEAQSTP